MTFVVIGKNSLIGTEMRRRFSGPQWLYLSHDTALADTSWADTATCVINFSLSPALRTSAYQADEDIDLKLANIIRSQKSHYIMMSSRMVYGTSACLRESDLPNPQAIYAVNKLVTEQSLAGLLAERLTILRGANVFGHEYGRKSFFGMALGNLRQKGQIIFDMNPAVKRDFIAAWHVAAAIGKIAVSPKSGIFNIGSGYGTSCRDIASWIIEGYGAGEIVSTNDDMRDEFYLDMSKSNAAFGIDILTPDIMRKDCQSCGETLKRLPA